MAKDTTDLRKLNINQVAQRTIMTNYRNGVLRPNADIAINRSIQRFGSKRKATGLRGSSNTSQFENRYMNSGGVSDTFFGKRGGVTINFITKEAQDVFDKMTGLTNREMFAIQVFVISQVRAGNWGTKSANYADSKMDYFTHFAMQEKSNSVISWRNDFIATPTADHIPGQGYDIPFTTRLINTGYNPFTSGIQYGVNDALSGVFIRKANDPASSTRVVIDQTGALTYIESQSNPQVRFRINEGIIETNVGDAIGDNELRVITRTATDRADMYLNGVSISNNISLSTNSIPNGNYSIGRISASDTFLALYSSFVAGTAIGFDHASYYNNLLILNAALDF